MGEDKSAYGEKREDELSPGDKLKAQIQAEVTTGGVHNRDESIQKIVKQEADSHLTNYPDRLRTDARQWITGFYAYLYQNYGYRPNGVVSHRAKFEKIVDGAKVTWEGWVDEPRPDFIKQLVDDYDISMIPFKGSGLEAYVKSLLGPDSQTNPNDLLRSLIKDRAKE